MEYECLEDVDKKHFKLVLKTVESNIFFFLIYSHQQLGTDRVADS